MNSSALDEIRRHPCFQHSMFDQQTFDLLVPLNGCVLRLGNEDYKGMNAETALQDFKRRVPRPALFRWWNCNFCGRVLKQKTLALDGIARCSLVQFHMFTKMPRLFLSSRVLSNPYIICPFFIERQRLQKNKVVWILPSHSGAAILRSLRAS